MGARPDRSRPASRCLLVVCSGCIAGYGARLAWDEYRFECCRPAWAMPQWWLHAMACRCSRCWWSLRGVGRMARLPARSAAASDRHGAVRVVRGHAAWRGVPIAVALGLAGTIAIIMAGGPACCRCRPMSTPASPSIRCSRSRCSCWWARCSIGSGVACGWCDFTPRWSARGRGALAAVTVTRRMFIGGISGSGPATVGGGRRGR